MSSTGGNTMNRLDKAKMLKAVYDGKGTALDALERLSRSSSSVMTAVNICRRSVPDPASREKVAMAFLTCYSAGLVAGLDSEGSTR